MSRRKKLPKCPHCGSTRELAWKTLSGVRLYREVDGRKLYEARCQDCGCTFEVPGKKAEAEE